MKASDTVLFIEGMLEAQLSVMIWGAPGIGKSAIVKDLAERKGYNFLDIRLSQMGPEDLQGVPFLDDCKRTGWGTPTMYPSTEDTKPTLIFFDEITHAPPAVQKSAYQIILDRQIGQYKFPKNTVMVAAGNRIEDRSGATDLGLALKNRFIHINMDPDLTDWAEWWVKNDKDSRILSYLRAAPDKLHMMPTITGSTENAFPTPRSWDFASTILRVFADNPQMRYEALKGCVGTGPASELEAHLRVELPDIETLLREPWTFKPPQDRSVLYAITSALTAYVTKDTMDGFMDIATRLADIPTEQDFAVAMAKDLFIKKPELIKNAKYIAWTARHQHLLL
jgi:hypothetical protein